MSGGSEGSTPGPPMGTVEWTRWQRQNVYDQMSPGEKQDWDLRLAIKNDDIETVRKFLDDGYPPDGHRPDDTWTPLRFTAEHDRVAVAKLLLERGAGVDLISYHRSALQHAVENVVAFGTDGALVTWELVDVLLDAGAELTDDILHTIQRGGPNVVQSFQSRGEPYEPTTFLPRPI